jgi:hypothetical protein
MAFGGRAALMANLAMFRWLYFRSGAAMRGPMLKLFAILALLSQPAMAQESKQEFEADAQACDKAADFAKCFKRDRMQRALTDRATKLVIEELGRRLDRIEKRLDEIERRNQPSSNEVTKGAH